MYTENEYDKPNFPLRKLLLKLLLIVTIIILLIWLVPKFLSYKKTNSNKSKTTEIKENSKINTSSMQKLENAGLKYFKEENIPTEVNDNKKVTLEQLEKENLIKNLKNSGKNCNVKKSYVNLTKTDDDYILKTSLTCGTSTDYKLLHVGKYSYCSGSLLCEKNEDEEQVESLKPPTSNENSNQNSNQNTPEVNDKTERTPVLSEFSKWQDYTKTSCDTKPVTCDINDTNCLQEIKIYTRTEEVGTKITKYQTEHTSLRLTNTTTQKTCSAYNYVVINNVIFKTKGNYGEILNLNKQTTNSWTYNGQISTTSSPSFGANEYYKYVGADTSNKTLFYYDSYKYNYAMERVTSYTSGCSTTTNKQISSYTVYKQPETYSKEEKVYATACYASVRTRTYN